MSKSMQQLMQKEMSRKEFLTLMGFGVASIFGFSAILKLLGKENPLHAQSLGYGSSTYGGRKRA